MPHGVAIRRAYSASRQSDIAARELCAALWQPAPKLVVFFCSTAFDLPELAAGIAGALGDALIIGCTTAGEITPLGYMDGTITGFSIAGEGVSVVAELVPGLSKLQLPQGGAAVDRLLGALRPDGRPADPDATFGLLLIDGMCAVEELVLTSLHRRLAPIPLLGGSAGDGMAFERSFVYFNGCFHTDAAVLAILELRAQFRIFRHQHLTASAVRMVVTGADPARRIVTEINAEPAAAEYARVVGLTHQELGPTIFAEYPPMVRVGGQYYVRSIQKANPDGSLTFFCAIDEGVVLTLARRGDMLEDLAAFFRDMRAQIGPPSLVIGFDCVLRNLEAETRQMRRVASKLLAANNVIGFNTYGEQFGGMHVNQTFTGVFIGQSEAR